MLINCDVKGLEVVAAAELSGDKVLKQEVIDKVDFHADNQKRFSLPDRVTAKRFIFKLLYGATAFGYSVDSDFIGVGYTQKQWQRVIDEFYAKYTGIYKWHLALLDTCKRNNGVIEIPSGRYYRFTPDARKREPWPLTTIKNYPVQGFGADLVKLARIEAYRRMGLETFQDNVLFVGTVHDSLVTDVDNDMELVYNISLLLRDSVEAVPDLCRKHFNYDFSLPLTAEVQFGPNKFDMKEVNFASIS